MGARGGGITEELVATLGACVAAVSQATLAELAEAADASIDEVRGPARARRAGGARWHAGPGNAVQLAPPARFGAAVRS